MLSLMVIELIAIKIFEIAESGNIVCFDGFADINFRRIKCNAYLVQNMNSVSSMARLPIVNNIRH